MSCGDSVNGSRTPEEAAADLRAELKRKTTEELFAATLEGDYEDDGAWEAISVLRLRGTLEVFETAKRYCTSDNPKARARGLSVLAQLGAGKPERPFLSESVALALKFLQDSDANVVSSAAWALSHLGTEPAVEALVKLRKHPDPEVRQAVACCFDLKQHSDCVAILIALMEDENEIVRDWATFELGLGAFVDGTWQCPDSPGIRAAFRRRLEDTCEDARREAIWALAKLRDTDGLKLLLDQLESGNWCSGDEEAAAEVLSAQTGTPVEELRAGLRQLLP